MAWGKARVFLVGLVVSMAGFASGAAAPASPVTTITWLASSITGTPNDPRQALIDAFEYANPDIKVELPRGCHHS